jgi:hypothetical protein
MGEGLPLSPALPPLPPVAKVIGKTFMFIWLQPPCQSDPDQFFLFVHLLCCLPCDLGTWFSSIR